MVVDPDDDDVAAAHADAGRVADVPPGAAVGPVVLLHVHVGAVQAGPRGALDLAVDPLVAVRLQADVSDQAQVELVVARNLEKVKEK